jgi:hypothetical protein
MVTNHRVWVQSRCGAVTYNLGNFIRTLGCPRRQNRGHDQPAPEADPDQPSPLFNVPKVRGHGAATDVRRILSLIASLQAPPAATRSGRSRITGDNGECVHWILPPQRISVPHRHQFLGSNACQARERALLLRKLSHSAIARVSGRGHRGAVQAEMPQELEPGWLIGSEFKIVDIRPARARAGPDSLF